MTDRDALQGGTADPGQGISERTAARIVAAARAAAAKKGQDVLVLEVGPVLAITEAFVIVSGASARHVRTLAEEIEKTLKSLDGRGPVSVEGLADATWVLLDYGDFVVHVFDSDKRRFYGLERLWADAAPIDWEDRQERPVEVAGLL